MTAMPAATDSTGRTDTLQPREFSAAQEDLRTRLPGTNIDPNSFLATDYLNHFNEAFMLLSMARDMPDMLEELTDWHPLDYERHFQQTGFPHKELAIEAYRIAPLHIREQFDETVGELSTLTRETINESQNLYHSGAMEDLAGFLEIRMEVLQKLHGELNAIIHCGPPLEEQAGQTAGPAEADDDCSDQAAIDALFD